MSLIMKVLLSLCLFLAPILGAPLESVYLGNERSSISGNFTIKITKNYKCHIFSVPQLPLDCELPSNDKEGPFILQEALHSFTFPDTNLEYKTELAMVICQIFFVH